MIQFNGVQKLINGGTFSGLENKQTTTLSKTAISVLKNHLNSSNLLCNQKGSCGSMRQPYVQTSFRQPKKYSLTNANPLALSTSVDRSAWILMDGSPDARICQVMNTCKALCVNILSIDFRAFFPLHNLLGLKFCYENSNVKIGTTIQKIRQQFLFLKDSKTLDSERTAHFSSSRREHTEISFLQCILEQQFLKNTFF